MKLKKDSIKRLLCLIAVACLLFFILDFLEIGIGEGHECSGAQCQICLLQRQLVEGVLLLAVAGMPFVALIFAKCEPVGASAASAHHTTPVCLKVKLSN